MANVRSGNGYYIDTQYSSNEELVEKSLRVTDVIITATSASAILVLADATTGTIKLSLRLATSGESKHVALNTPLVFPNGIRPTTLTNCVATVVFTKA